MVVIFTVGQGIAAACHALLQPELAIIAISRVGKATFAHAGKPVGGAGNVAMLTFLPVNRPLSVIDDHLFALFQHFYQPGIFRHPAALHPGNVLLHSENNVALTFVIADVGNRQIATGVKLPQHPLL